MQCFSILKTYRNKPGFLKLFIGRKHLCGTGQAVTLIYYTVTLIYYNITLVRYTVTLIRYTVTPIYYW